MHVVTVNDYLARRDSEWVGQVPRFLGMQVRRDGVCVYRDMHAWGSWVHARNVAVRADVLLHGACR